MITKTESEILILYATQTNTAKHAAEELGRECSLRKLTPRIMEMDEFPIIQLPLQKLVVFIVATTGEGEPPFTMQKTWQFLLRSDLPSNSLQQLNFTVFGLGDSAYALFNAMAKKLTTRLMQLGGKLMHKVGLGDYQHDFGYEGEFDPWMQSLWPFIRDSLPQAHLMKLEPDTLSAPQPVYSVVLDNEQIKSGLNCLPKPHGAW